MKTAVRMLAVVAAVGLAPLSAVAQTTTGTLSGQVVDSANLPVPGVTVTVQSPTLQGLKTTTTSDHGDYVVPFLPAGDYVVTFELMGFEKVEKRVRLAVAANEPLNVKLGPAAVDEQVTVIAEAKADFTQTSTIATSYTASAIDKLPVARDLNGAVLLAPGTTDNGPGGNIMIAGAPSFENLFLVNGVVVNETLRGSALPLYIEDAIEETKTSIGNVSAEYGRLAAPPTETTVRRQPLQRLVPHDVHEPPVARAQPDRADADADPRADAIVPAHEGTPATAGRSPGSSPRAVTRTTGPV